MSIPPGDNPGMNQDELRALGERWKACPGFRWRPGMADLDGYRVLEADHDFASVIQGGYGHSLDCNTCEMAPPDLSDPATRGWLLEDVREAWGDHTLHPDTVESEWTMWLPGSPVGRWLEPKSSEIEALVCAREAAPR